MTSHSNHPSAELVTLCGIARDGSLTPEQFARLESLLNESGEARRYYVQFFQLHSWMMRQAANAAQAASSADVAPHELPIIQALTRAAIAPAMKRQSRGRIPARSSPHACRSSSPAADRAILNGAKVTAEQSEQSVPESDLCSPFVLEPSVGRPRWFNMSRRKLAMAALLVFGVVGYRLFVQRQVADDLSARVVAEFISGERCVWENRKSNVQAGDELRSGDRLHLTRGMAKLRFTSGTTLVVESPTLFELATEKTIRLEQGTVAVRANGSEKEFVVVSPDATIVDLGTSFGVHREARLGTEVSVFEGAVEVRETVDSGEGRVLGVGASARISSNGRRRRIDVIASDGRFDNLLDLLWDAETRASNERPGTAVVAEFDDAPIPGTVDTFYGSTHGRGWRSPWMATGNPIAEIRHYDPLSHEGDPYLHIRFQWAVGRVIAREYGARSGFDPNLPHVISWKWRFDGKPEHFGLHPKDRVLFYGSTRFRTNTSGANTWRIRLAAADEQEGSFRAVYPMRWCFYDRGESGRDHYNEQTLVDTGLNFKPGVVYHFAVAVYPLQGCYDAAVRDDEQTMVHTGMKFANSQAMSARVLHFGTRSEDRSADLAFSLDSLRIEPLDERPVHAWVQ